MAGNPADQPIHVTITKRIDRKMHDTRSKLEMYCTASYEIRLGKDQGAGGSRAEMNKKLWAGRNFSSRPPFSLARTSLTPSSFL